MRGRPPEHRAPHRRRRAPRVHRHHPRRRHGPDGHRPRAGLFGPPGRRPHGRNLLHPLGDPLLRPRLHLPRRHERVLLRPAGTATSRATCVTRGAWLVLLELTVIRVAWTFNFDFAHYLLAGVIWVIGWCMILMAGLVRLPVPAVGAIGLAIIAGHNLAGSVPGPHHPGAGRAQPRRPVEDPLRRVLRRPDRARRRRPATHRAVFDRSLDRRHGGGLCVRHDPHHGAANGGGGSASRSASPPRRCSWCCGDSTCTAIRGRGPRRRHPTGERRRCRRCSRSSTPPSIRPHSTSC